MNEAADDDIRTDSDTNLDLNFGSDDDVVSEVSYFHLMIILHKLYTLRPLFFGTGPASVGYTLPDHQDLSSYTKTNVLTEDHWAEHHYNMCFCHCVLNISAMDMIIVISVHQTIVIFCSTAWAENYCYPVVHTSNGFFL